MNAVTTVEEKYDTSLACYDTKYGTVNLPTVDAGLSKKEKNFLDLALKLAETSDVDQRHGAVVVAGGRVLSLGVNKWRNKGLYQVDEGYKPVLTVHAEMDALSRVADPRGAVIYIARAGADGSAKFSRPCFRCMEVIEKLGVKRVVYTVD